MLKVRPNLIKIFSLFILLIPSLKTASPPRDPQPSSSNTDITHVLLTGDQIGQEEISAVGGNIPAIYIVRVVKKQLAELGTSQGRTMEAVKGIMDEQRAHLRDLVGMFKDRQFLGKNMHEQDLKEQVVRKFVKGSQFTVEQLEKLGTLPDALKDETKAKEYLEMLEKLIQEFSDKVEELQVHKEINIVALSEQKQQDGIAQQPQTNLFEFVHQLCVEHVNFLEQIRLEVELYYEFPKELRALEENTQYLEKYKAEKESQHARETKKPKEKLLKSKLSEKRKQKLLQSINTAVANYLEPVKLIDALLNLNNMAENLYKETEAIIKWSFKNGQKYVTSIMEVAKIAAKEENEKDLYEIDAVDLYERDGIVKAKNYLENLFYMCDAVHSILPKLPTEWRIHDQIRDKLEMPIEWYSKFHAIAYPNIHGEYEVTEEMVHLRVKLLLAKTLLVYERLNKFYKIDGPYKVWKEGKMPKELPYRLLKPYDQLEQEKREAAANPPGVHGHGQHA